MTEAGKKNIFRKYVLKSMGLLLAPLTFALIICGILLLVANLTVGDVIGYGSILLMKPPAEDYQISDFLTPTEADDSLEPEEGKNTVDIADVTFPLYEQVYGEISIPEAEILCPLVFGDTEAALKKGAGQFIGSKIIGYGGTTMVCAHVNRQFANLHNVEVGDEIQVRTAYGVYTYEVKHVGVHDASDDSVYDLGREDENLVLYTCYYQYTALGSVKRRFFVCADYTSGPMISDGGGQ